jgi:hypothetical protein
MTYNHTIRVGENPLSLGEHHSFMIPLPSYDGAYHYFMSTVKTICDPKWIQEGLKIKFLEIR